MAGNGLAFLGVEDRAVGRLQRAHVTQPAPNSLLIPSFSPSIWANTPGFNSPPPDNTLPIPGCTPRDQGTDPSAFGKEATHPGIGGGAPWERTLPTAERTLHE